MKLGGIENVKTRESLLEEKQLEEKQGRKQERKNERKLYEENHDNTFNLTKAL